MLQAVRATDNALTAYMHVVDCTERGQSWSKRDTQVRRAVQVHQT